MSKLIVMIGLQGSGKSFAAHNKINSEGNWLIFSSDEYRKLICGDENCQTRNQEVFTRLYQDLRQALIGGKDCIFDATNICRKDRSKLFHQIQGISDVEVIAYVMRTPIKLCLDRDRERTRTVGFNVIDKFIRRFEFPQRFEGFSKIIIDNEPCEDIDIVYDRFQRCLEDMKDWDQANPHHINSLYDHAFLLADHFPRDSAVFFAGIVHDIGKMIVNHYDDQGIAHYYNHDSVGTYYILSELYPLLIDRFTSEEIEFILFLVNYHMKGHKDVRGNAEVKYRRLFGDVWYQTLIDFANADIEASGTESIHDLLYQWIKIDKLTLDEIRNKNEFIQLVEESKRRRKEYAKKW